MHGLCNTCSFCHSARHILHREIRAVFVGFIFHLSSTMCSPWEDWKGQRCMGRCYCFLPSPTVPGIRNICSAPASSGCWRTTIHCCFPVMTSMAWMDKTQVLVPSFSSCSWTKLCMDARREKWHLQAKPASASQLVLMQGLKPSILRKAQPFPLPAGPHVLH